MVLPLQKHLFAIVELQSELLRPIEATRSTLDTFGCMGFQYEPFVRCTQKCSMITRPWIVLPNKPYHPQVVGHRPDQPCQGKFTRPHKLSRFWATPNKLTIDVLILYLIVSSLIFQQHCHHHPKAKVLISVTQNNFLATKSQIYITMLHFGHTPQSRNLDVSLLAGFCGRFAGFGAFLRVSTFIPMFSHNLWHMINHHTSS